MSNLQTLKQRFSIIGNNVKLNRAIEKAVRVAPTDISVLVTGESGVGKESIPKIIHSLSHRKHSKFIAINCGAIPEGTIDSELFGHEKGSFTGATATRKGYFEEADGGTIFLDEVGELPLNTQVRLLRVLESKEFIKVGASQAQKTNVRILAATNLDMFEAIKKHKFREDFYFRLSTVEISLPPLRERKEDIDLLYRKFASDFAHKYKMPTVRLDDNALKLLQNYHWVGNIRQLRNVAEQVSVLEKERLIDAPTLKNYLPNMTTNLAVISQGEQKQHSDFSNEREILYKILFDMKNDLNDLKKLTLELIRDSGNDIQEKKQTLIKKIYGSHFEEEDGEATTSRIELPQPKEVIKEKEITYKDDALFDYSEEVEEELSLQKKELETIKRSLEKNRGRRKITAEELGISERTLYRKIKQYDLE